MREGLEYLPWFAQRRRETGHDPFDCDRAPCKVPDGAHPALERAAAQVKAEWGCGFVPLQIRRAPGPNVVVGLAKAKPSVCPAYAIRLPAVREAARAAFWAEKGQLELRYPDEPVTELLMDCVELYQVASNEVDEYQRKERERKNKPPGAR